MSKYIKRKKREMLFSACLEGRKVMSGGGDISLIKVIKEVRGTKGLVLIEMKL